MQHNHTCLCKCLFILFIVFAKFKGLWVPLSMLRLLPVSPGLDLVLLIYCAPQTSYLTNYTDSYAAISLVFFKVEEQMMLLKTSLTSLTWLLKYVTCFIDGV